MCYYQKNNRKEKQEHGTKLHHRTSGLLSLLALKSSQRSAVSTDADFPLHQEITCWRPRQYDWVFIRWWLFGWQSLAHNVLRQAQKQIDHFSHWGQASWIRVVQRMGGEQWLLLDGDLIAEARVDQHCGVSHSGLFRTLDELQLRSLHHYGIPKDWQCGGAQRV